MVSALRPQTWEDLWAIPEDGNRYELMDGEVVVSPPPRRKHQDVARVFYDVLNDHVRAASLGTVYFAPADVRTSPYDTVQPDLFFIRRERLHIYRPDGVMEEPPDLVVEILSPSTRSRDLVRKAAWYARAGVPEYWTVDPDTAELRIRVLKDGRYEEVAPEDDILRSTVLPKQTVVVAAIFATRGERGYGAPDNSRRSSPNRPA